VSLNIKSGEADRLARELAALTGESLTEAVTVALAERLQRCRRPSNAARKVAIRAIRERVSRMPVLDDRSDEELLGYDDSGLFR
jgi:antitoxin VapB